jgi:hypothetical protein
LEATLRSNDTLAHSAGFSFDGPPGIWPSILLFFLSVLWYLKFLPIPINFLGLGRRYWAYLPWSCLLLFANSAFHLEAAKSSPDLPVCNHHVRFFYPTALLLLFGMSI